MLGVRMLISGVGWVGMMVGLEFVGGRVNRRVDFATETGSKTVGILCVRAQDSQACRVGGDQLASIIR